MTEGTILFGLKSIARHLNISVPKAKHYLLHGLPHTRDDSGMYITTPEDIKSWFQQRIAENCRKKKP